MFLGVHGMDDAHRFHHPEPAGGRDQPRAGRSRRAGWSSSPTTPSGAWSGISTIATLAEADVLITDTLLDPEAEAVLREHVGEVVLAEPSLTLAGDLS